MTSRAAELDGVSLLLEMAGESDPFFHRRPIVSESYPYRSVLTRGLHSPDLGAPGTVEIYDLDRDPREHAPLRGEAAKEARQRLERALELAARRPIPETDTLVGDEKALEHLRALGYLD